MTREEAIGILNETQVVYFASNGKKKVQEALDMAIEALKADVARWSSWNKTFEQSGIADLISRADAIEAVRKELVCDGRHETHDKTCRFIADVLLSALPSAKPKVVRVEYSPFTVEETSTLSQTSFRGTQEVKIIELPSAETHEIRTETHGVCLISKDDAMGAVQDHFNANGFNGYDDGQKMMDRITALPSADAKMTEEVREALMRLTMCAREECDMCKYKDECDYDFQYKISTDNMNTLSDALLRSKCEVDAKWIPCSERLPEEGRYLVTTTLSAFSPQILNYDADGEKWFYDGCKSMDVDVPCVTAWMSLPMPYREDGEEC